MSFERMRDEEVLRYFAKFGFVSKYGHKLEECKEFQTLLKDRNRLHKHMVYRRMRKGSTSNEEE